MKPAPPVTRTRAEETFAGKVPQTIAKTPAGRHGGRVAGVDGTLGQAIEGS